MDSSWWLDKLQRLPELAQDLAPWIDKQSINTFLLFVVLYLIGRARRKMRRDLQYYLDTISQKLSALRDEVESIPEPLSSEVPPPSTAAPPYAGVQYWEEIREMWSTARDGIETVIEGLSAASRRPYSRFSRRTYVPIISRLRLTDRAISEDTAQRLLKMSGIFMSNRPTASRTTKITAEEFKKLFDEVMKVLPKPPDDDGPTPTA
jgi:hypothetical protein